MSTLLPFLYQTRTLQRAIRGPLPQLVRALHGTPSRQHPRKPPSGHSGPGGGDDSVPFEFGPDQGPLAATRGKKGPSTITESEKRVFDEIFGSISQRQKQLGVPLVPDLEPEPPAFAREPEEGMDEQELNRERILAMYPPALRRAAEIALGLQAEEDGEDFADGHAGASPTQVTPEDAEEARRMDELMAAERGALLALHREEKARVQSLMQSCTTDVALWKVLEDHVFSMVERLGISNRKLDDPNPKRRGKKSPKNKPAPPALSMERHGPLYSVHLLSAVRHLDRGFATPSPLALNVLPRILDLGMASYVLGVSTRFYNEVMSIYWHRYGDVHSVMRLLKEMERAGLSGDGQTLRVVEAIMGTIEGLSADEGRNAFADVLGSMQEFDSIVLGKLGRRKKWVLSSMQERADELPY